VQARPVGVHRGVWWPILPGMSATSETWSLLTRASHPKRAFLTAAGLAGAAAASGREAREVGLVAATVLVGQAVLGWHNDVVDATRDRAALEADDDLETKPLAAGTVRPANAWFAMACGVLVLVPLALTNGVVAGACYLGSVVVGLLGNLALRRSRLSIVPWAVAFAAYPYFLSYGGWGGFPPAGDIGPPRPLLVALAAILGVCVHFVGALPDLVQDNRVGYRHLPLRLGLRTGATRLLVLTVLATAAVAGGIVGAAFAGGLRT
jgi:4-hydroxybenzoate polyprenyltransferase